METGVETVDLQYKAQVNPSLQDLIAPRYTGGKLTVPLRSNSLYISFKHVQGIPNSGGSGVSTSRLRTLDTLISRLVHMKKREESSPDVDVTGLSDAAVDALIRNLSEELSIASKMDPVARVSGGFGMAGSPTGVVLDMIA